MKKLFWVLTALFLIAFLILGIFIGIRYQKDKGTVPALNIIGDIESPRIITDLEMFKDFKTIDFKGEKHRVINLKYLIDVCKPCSPESRVVFISEDGRTAELDYRDTEFCYISFDMESGWQSINPSHPINTNTKTLSDIIVISEENLPEKSFNIIGANENIFSISPGRAYLESSYFYVKEGDVSFSKEGRIFPASIYSRKYIIDTGKLLEERLENVFLVYGRNGEIIMETEPGVIEVEENMFNYMDREGNYIVRDVLGIMIDPPNATIMDAYYDIRSSLDENEPVMLIILDGFGYHQYIYSIENGYAPYLKTISKPEAAYSVYKPVTNSAVASMISGSTPDETGIHDRSKRELDVDTIFAYAKEQNKETLFIEGDIQVIKTEIEAELNLDDNNNGTIDDEIFNFLMKNVDESYDLIVAHFHSIDDSGHDYGDLDINTMNAIKVIDGFIEQILEIWDGSVIMTADHGMHETETGGTHGDFTYKDLIVPYFYIDKN